MKKIFILFIIVMVMFLSVVAHATSTADAMRLQNDDTLVVYINNISHLKIDTAEDIIAKNLSLTEMMKIADERKDHDVIRSSKVFNLLYQKIDVKKMKEQDIIDTGNYLAKKLPRELHNQSADEISRSLPENERRLMGIRIFALEILSQELKKRHPAPKYANIFQQQQAEAKQAYQEGRLTYSEYLTQCSNIEQSRIQAIGVAMNHIEQQQNVVNQQKILRNQQKMMENQANSSMRFPAAPSPMFEQPKNYDVTDRFGNKIGELREQ